MTSNISTEFIRVFVFTMINLCAKFLKVNLTESKMNYDYFYLHYEVIYGKVIF